MCCETKRVSAFFSLQCVRFTSREITRHSTALILCYNLDSSPHRNDAEPHATESMTEEALEKAYMLWLVRNIKKILSLKHKAHSLLLTK